MKLLRLRMQNFRCFAAAELDLNVTGLIGVVGANGAGKSTIFSAVEWALFGGKRGLGAMPARRQGSAPDEPCVVELDFEADGRTYNVRRVDGKQAALTDLESGVVLATTLTDTSRQAAATLGLTHEMFCGTFYARQREVQALAESAKASERREQLERLLGIEHLRRAAELARSDVKEQKMLLDALASEVPDVASLSTDVERIEREAQQAAPAVLVAEQLVARLRGESKTTNDRLDALTAQAQLHAERALAAQQHATDLGREQAVLGNLRGQLNAANAAAEELATLEPVAVRLDALLASEREMDLRRSRHQQLEELRSRQRSALVEAAALGDELRALPDTGDDLGELTQQVERVQTQLTELAEQRRSLAAERQDNQKLVSQLREELDRCKSAATLSIMLGQIGAPEAAVDAARKLWAKLRDERATVAAAVAHAVEHRDALRAGGESAACPTCGEPFKTSYAELLTDFEHKIEFGQTRLQTIEGQIETATADGKRALAEAERAQTLRAQLNALGERRPESQLHALLVEADRRLADQLKAEQEKTQTAKALTEAVPELRRRTERALATAKRRAALDAKRAQTERDAALFAEQIAQAGSNGYDVHAHTSLRTELQTAHDASRRCSALRSASQSVEMLGGRARQQSELVNRLTTEQGELVAKAAQIAVNPGEQEQLRRQRDALADQLHAAQTQLSDAKRQAERDSRAVTAARQRLDDGRRALRKIAAERREYEWRHAVADALAEYRADASQRARPLVDRSASALLARVSGNRYTDVRLDDSYLLQIADERQLHPLKRFSGGEQDLASLCLRLALSRTLAEQRGVEAGFVILDEVFGSQDQHRRELLLDQLSELAVGEFQQVFVISHTDDVIQHSDVHIFVERHPGQPSVALGPQAASQFVAA
jgi:exonuclease SbcC